MLTYTLSGFEDPNVRKASEKAEELLNAHTGNFLNEVKKIDDFDHTNINGQQLVDEVIIPETKKEKREIIIKLYNSSSRANAYFTTKYPNTIFLNSAKLKRSKESLTNTIVHETLHVFDHAIGRFRFGHAGNDRTGKENTVPYKVGRLAYIAAKTPSASGGQKKNSAIELYKIYTNPESNFADPKDTKLKPGNYLIKNVSFSLTVEGRREFKINLSLWSDGLPNDGSRPVEGLPINFDSLEELLLFYNLVIQEEDMEISLSEKGEITFNNSESLVPSTASTK